MKRLITLLLALMLVAGGALADGRPLIHGHMKPLQSELLAQPIKLQDCPGLTIREWRGGRSSDAIRHLNQICKRAIAEFPKFIAMKGLKKLNDEPFEYSISLIPNSKNYRSMNDVRYRFANRFVKGLLWAYTSRDKKYIFMVNTIHIPEIPMIFSHELFHALSMHYGIFDSHALFDKDKVRIDEGLADEFTVYLGLGK